MSAAPCGSSGWAMEPGSPTLNTQMCVMLSSPGRQSSARSISPADHDGKSARVRPPHKCAVLCTNISVRVNRRYITVLRRTYGTLAIFFLSNAFVINVLRTYCPVVVCCRLQKYRSQNRLLPIRHGRGLNAWGGKGGWGYNRVHCMEHGRVGRSEMGYAAVAVF